MTGLVAGAAPSAADGLTGPSPLAGSPVAPAERFDVALLDLDGVVYRGETAVPRAAEAVAFAVQRGMRAAYVTNNALRTPESVAGRLVRFGLPASAADVITSAQAAAHVLAQRLSPGAAVLVVGGEGLRSALAAEGLKPVTSADDTPLAVAQGFDPDLTYARLAEGALAIRAGALWVASNGDLTVPTERGIAPGNGSLVAMLKAATGAVPLVTGKPEPAMHAESMRRSGARRPLIVGDRLDTDIEAGTRSGTPTLLVFTGVTTPSELLAAAPEHRPTMLSADLRGLLTPHPAAVTAGPGVARCGGWLCEVDDEGTLSWRATDQDGRAVPDDGLDALRAACAAAWSAADGGRPVGRLAAERPVVCAGLTL